MYPIHKAYLFDYLFEGNKSTYTQFNNTSDPIRSMKVSEDMHPPVSPNYFLRSSVKKSSKLQYEAPTEILQAIFLELATINDAKAVITTCHRMNDAFNGYKKTIIWTILCRELGPTLPGTFGALAIFVSPRKGPVDEKLFLERKMSARYWAPMLREHGELARRLLTLAMAARMLAVYRRFPKEVNYSAGGECSACVSSTLADGDWDPREENTVGNCLEHLLQANAVRFRLKCRMVLDYKKPAEIPGVWRGVSGLWWDWW
ncbi:hypothetical protein INS49_014162 [Diaporthe citri]|uniref:uncharacterized protein n=1 Tax=Diaporthe citri TaxID=83186 RepID=UPI001C81F131|nr:uncharacterized protein INS49_014162 [Diaporthe citri]KAG6358278.1 hypothetical protein INS49_014162 [Diaporthe citri]